MKEGLSHLIHRKDVPFDPRRRWVVAGAAAVIASAALGLESDVGGLFKRLEFNDWKQTVPEGDPKYSELWDAALTRIGKRLPSGLLCEHRGNSREKVTKVCDDYSYNYCESDWRFPDGVEEVWAMHKPNAVSNMTYPIYRGCVSMGLAKTPPHEILEKLDIKDGRAYTHLIPLIEKDYKGKQVIVNHDRIGVFKTVEFPHEQWLKECGKHQNIIWSIGYDHFNDFGKSPARDAFVSDRVIELQEMTEGNFTFPINALDFESVHGKDPGYFSQMRDAGVMFTIYYGDGYRVPNGVMDAIMQSGIPPWQVICDFK